MAVEERRESWSRSVEYLLATAGYAVGLGNVWRFPYLCYRSGGGEIFYFFTSCQHTSKMISKDFVLFTGAGIATVVISFLFTTYYNVIITWAFYYLFSSFTSKLPWSDCSNDWNSDDCFDGVNKTVFDPVTNVTSVILRTNDSLSPTEDFYERGLLEKSSGIDEPGVLKWDLSLILLMCWILVYFCIWKGPKLTGKVVYFTATFPYVVLLVLLVRGLTLPGAMNGILYFIVPRWKLLLDANVWVNAAAQTFNSLGIAFGGIITMSSYNKRKNRILKDVLIIGVVDAVTCLLAGFAIFSILGFLAHDQDKDVEEVIKEGPGLVFVIYPSAFSSMPVSQLISALFFFMLICLGIDSQFASVEVIVTTIQDHFAPQVKKYLRRKELLVLVVCVVSFLCGLPNVTQGGVYFFQLIDYYAAAMSLMYLAFFEVIAITWFYGAKKLAKNIEQMNGAPPSVFFIVCWYGISPLLILGIWIFSLVQYKPFSVANYEYPGWAIGLGWFIAALSIICIPGAMVHSVVTAQGKTLWQKFKNSLKPQAIDMEEKNEDIGFKDITFPVDDCYLENGGVIFKGQKPSDSMYPALNDEVQPLSYKHV
ncbi:sodium- and chloride-dependent GABA transporter ine-like [Ruditapes philippinarum]|uniref:sodium- and chloride-dependent GABA transporter ine-like n=1 Tax=Ruditapes philippinarum TaxID=129788 RepID=UPI00295B2744|nr:sodium- and chloride-dependent GABA transporter ine-like [Ruditapes philippinarum]